MFLFACGHNLGLPQWWQPQLHPPPQLPPQPLPFKVGPASRISVLPRHSGQRIDAPSSSKTCPHEAHLKTRFSAAAMSMSSFT